MEKQGWEIEWTADGRDGEGLLEVGALVGIGYFPEYDPARQLTPNYKPREEGRQGEVRMSVRQGYGRIIGKGGKGCDIVVQTSHFIDDRAARYHYNMPGAFFLKGSGRYYSHELKPIRVKMYHVPGTETEEQRQARLEQERLDAEQAKEIGRMRELVKKYPAAAQDALIEAKFEDL